MSAFCKLRKPCSPRKCGAPADTNTTFVGRRETPKGNPIYSSEGLYLDIVPDARIISAGTMNRGETPISTTLCTIELLAEGVGTRLILTDQSAFLAGREKPSDREGGWGAIRDKLEAHLTGAGS
jgi:uncharacterized protein YndB with AHSA1/START domain